MLDAFIVFITSAVVLVILIVHKIWEIKRGRTFISKEVLPKTDSLIKGQIDFHKGVIIGGGKHGMKALSSITRESIKHLLLVSAHFLHDHLTKLIIRVKGKGLKNKKSVSFFLKRMEEYKEDKTNGMNSNQFSSHGDKVDGQDNL